MKIKILDILFLNKILAIKNKTKVIANKIIVAFLYFLYDQFFCFGNQKNNKLIVVIKPPIRINIVNKIKIINPYEGGFSDIYILKYKFYFTFLLIITSPSSQDGFSFNLFKSKNDE